MPLEASPVMFGSCSGANWLAAVLSIYQEGKLCPRFDRAMRRLFRIYDVDRDGLLRNDELNAFQFHAFRLLLSHSDLESLRKVSRWLLVVFADALVSSFTPGCSLASPVFVFNISLELL